MKDLVVLKGQKAVTTSLRVAEVFRKRHDNVLEAIRGLLKNKGTQQMFEESSYINPQNKQEYPMFYMNRDGYTLLAMGFNGKRALSFKLKYIEAFNKMEKFIKQRNAISIDSSLEHEKLIANGDLNFQRQDLEYHRRYVAVKEQEAANKRAELLIKIGDRQEEERYRQAYYTEATNQLMFPITSGLAVTAGAIAEQLGTNAYNIGKWGQILGLKAPKGHRSQYGYWSGDRYYYNEKAIEKFQEHKKEIVDDDNDLGL